MTKEVYTAFADTAIALFLSKAHKSSGPDVALDRNKLKVARTRRHVFRPTELVMGGTEPLMMATACELLRACAEIMGQRIIDPDGRFGEGPVLDIIRNCLKALDWVPADLPVGDPKRRRRKARAARQESRRAATKSSSLPEPLIPA